MYQIGQFRRPQFQQSFFEDIGINGELKQTQAEDQTIQFWDFFGTLSNGVFLNSQNYYYLRFKVQRKDANPQNFTLKLLNTEVPDSEEQTIRDVLVDRGQLYSYHEIIFAPNSQYNQIIWDLQRTGEDYRTFWEQDDTMGRKPEITIEAFGRVKNILDFLHLTKLTKIGVQGPPSLLMCINGEQIRIGKSGIYELNNNMPVTFIGFIPKVNATGQLDYFIMDFEYQNNQ